MEVPVHPYSINSVLRKVFCILNLEKASQPEAFGSSVFSKNDVYARFLPFALQVKSLLSSSEHEGSGSSSNNKKKRLYMAKVDVRRAYDTIVQKKLFEVLEPLLREDEYRIVKFVAIQSSPNGKLFRKFENKAFPAWDFPQFIEVARDYARVHSNVILADQVVYQHVSREDALALLEEHIFRNLIKMGKDFLVQKEGIAQGSRLSALLCNLHYGHMERSLLADLQHADKDEPFLLMRQIDDFLCITTSKARAQKFVQVLHQGSPEYGVSVNEDKTVSSFALDTMMMTSQQSRADLTEVPWCGWIFDTHTLEVYGDYSRYCGNRILPFPSCGRRYPIPIFSKPWS